MENSLKEAALKFHEFPVPGKVSVTPTKSLATSKPADTGATNNLAMICVLSIWRLSVLEVARRRRDADVTAMA